ncbi:MAG: 16S rRNA processing protein RimM [Clostridiaceae bacterium]|nr:16S rRNA processing protein RimM [Clostridiaceae bacterium]
MVEYLTVGKITNTHGVRGEMKVIPATSDISRFDYLKIVWVEKDDKLTEYFVEKVRYHKNFVLVKLHGIDTMDKAAEFKNCYLKVDRRNARPLDEYEYFIADLIGCEVYEQDVLLGKITNVLQTGSNDVYVVNGDKYRELLIPALKHVVLNIDIENRKIQVILPEGLIDL